MAEITITLRKSSIGERPEHKGTLRALGLKKIGTSVTKKDSPEIRGMVFKVKHLVEVTNS
jgi:large subunit ribosomal protein L30